MPQLHKYRGCSKGDTDEHHNTSAKQTGTSIQHQPLRQNVCTRTATMACKSHPSILSSTVTPTLWTSYAWPVSPIASLSPISHSSSIPRFTPGSLLFFFFLFFGFRGISGPSASQAMSLSNPNALAYVDLNGGMHHFIEAIRAFPSNALSLRFVAHTMAMD